MARNIDSTVKTASLASVVKLAMLMEADFDSGSVNLFAGYGQIVVDGITYTGSGTLVDLDPAQEVAEIQAASATVQLSGVQEDDIALALTEPYRRRPARIRLALFDDSSAIIGAPVTIFSGRMDVMALNDDPANPTLTLSCENDFIRMNRARFRNRTHEDQQIDYPGDLGLEFVASMQNKTIYV